ncbi:MAG: dihydroorotate dehydrogenase [Chlorobi bacterium]|nr:dihydroorotate dehydrogenase [Chlorobiota bacterium]
MNLNVNIGRLTLQNPVMLASGTVGYGNEISEFIDLSKIGAIVTKSISLKPRKGNPPRRVVETASGMLNAIGLANVGIENFIKEKIPFLKELGTTLIANIAASSIDEYVECVKLLDDIETVKGFEINVSCPNVKEGGLIFGNNVDNVKRITEKVRAATEKNVIVKLSPNTANIADFARAVKDNGGDAVSAINTLVGSAFDIYTRKPKIKNITGGLSGPAIKPVAIAKVLEISRNVDIPIIGIGGISNWKDAVEFMIAGASAAQLGTINFVNPTAAIETLDGIKGYCKNMSVKNISEIISSRILR